MKPAFLVVLLAGCAASTPSGSAGGGGSGGSGKPVEICDNGLDDDGNDAIDCADPACLKDPRCPVCGDGHLDGREACEGGDLRGQSCSSLGFDGGLLGCSPPASSTPRAAVATNVATSAGDEDGNGKADCADRACARYPSCLKLEVKRWTLPPTSPARPGWSWASPTPVADRSPAYRCR